MAYENDKPTTLTVNHSLTSSMRGKPYLAAIMSLRGHLVITMSPGQWDDLIAGGYDVGALLVEVGDDARVRRVYQRAGT